MKSPTLFKALEEFQRVHDEMDASHFVVALAASLVAAFAASGMYKVFYERRGTGSQVHRAFPLLGLSITTLFVTVQISIPLSLGLLGALSIIRFRTPIKEPEEVGFIMLLIATSVSAATFNYVFLALLLGVALIALLLVRLARGWTWPLRDGMLVLQLTDAEATNTWPRIEACLATHVRRLVLETSASREGITSLHLGFNGLKTSVAELQQAVRSVSAPVAINVFLDRPGGLR